MKNIAVLFAGNLSRYAHVPVSGGPSAFERALQRAADMPGVKKTVVLGDEGLPEPDGWEAEIRSEWTVSSLLEALEGISGGFEDIFYYFADCPLVDGELTKEMYSDHREYFAEYTFADGYPLGLAPEILKKSIIKPLMHLADGDDAPVTRDALFRVLQRDINAFDIETKLSPVDLRLLRISLACDTRRNHLLVERIIEAGGRDERTILSVLQERADLLRTLPAYAGIQITDRYPRRITYLPEEYYPAAGTGEGREMSPESFVPLVKNLADFAGDITLALSYRGEPALHSSIEDIIKEALGIPGVHLLLETGGTDWRDGVIEDILSVAGDRLTWIVELDARDPALYRKLRGDGYEEAYRTAEMLVSGAPAATYVQAVRMKDNEEDLEQFYRFWKEKTEHVIIKKYDYFCSLLPQLKVTDLSPLKRFPCWHIKRDLYVLVDGRVPMCGEDLQPSRVLGNAFTDSVEDLWSGGERIYASHISGEYPPLCAECDEYYTFNF